MGLLQPELGLLFWTSLAFGVVLFLLCKFGFPVADDRQREMGFYVFRRKG